MTTQFCFCPVCATPLANIALMEDGGEKIRRRCPACGYTHWNNPTPVLAAVIEYQGKVLLARNAAWPGKMFALITGFMEAGETPQGGIAREIKEETALETTSLDLIGVYDFQRMNQIIIAYHAVCHGEVSLSPELAEYRLYDLDQLKCWPAGTGYALADWLRSRGHEPRFIDWEKNST
ncbi:MAG: NUDIX hydrolase [Polaromonas sp. 39-63-203]|jgi:NADH pyrophosphatase NudC (nudix superfamily)|uniref:NUDIX hydrolase n=1 Tax=Polaromonas sp. TaxID=1869339 RepID=UPI000BCDB90C|nr:NUDIX hydrolase [Polaromonas sp.]OYY52630.1 MAG: NUDIX hydrolase [Polaromonas sp. 35-63-240]OYY97989.1 MAG: NUDIX hydrolase [Polaromonas sp. 28-63-22]OYZ83836.1 MAG: NUDIX hydrolase [Polaromonas sp. 24-62-144]OZA98494.1 MAG: NUDIX hydrolase [Polaromonas sp. 39-63-203]HQS30421.1 NUDIX hydrolase [Polaromonas sp.]